MRSAGFTGAQRKPICAKVATLCAPRLPSALTSLCSRDPRCHGDWPKQGRRSSASSSLLFFLSSGWVGGGGVRKNAASGSTGGHIGRKINRVCFFFLPGPRSGPASCTVLIRTCTPAHVMHVHVVLVVVLLLPWNKSRTAFELLH